MKGPEVRPFQERDYTGACRLEEERTGSGYSSVVFIRQASILFPSFFFIAEQDQNVVGYGIGALNQADQKEGWILRLRVKGEFQRQGIGRRILERVVQSLDGAGADKILLSVAPGNERARRLYQKSGFLETRMIPSYFGPGEDRIVMVLPMNRYDGNEARRFHEKIGKNQDRPSATGDGP